MFLALHDACGDLGRLEEARSAIARGVPRLVTRLKGLAGTPYPRAFLTHLAPNAGLLSAAEAYGLIPDEVTVALADELGGGEESERRGDDEDEGAGAGVSEPRLGGGP